jgi:predicted nucleotide-binding protein (sugar kinase/HSP70/actin superfamily)
MGAIGMALIASEWAKQAKRPSRFRGYDRGRTRLETRDFLCKACTNYCEMKEITIDGERTYWGDRCSDKFRKPARTARTPCIEDLVALRERALLDGYSGPAGRGPRVGIPQATYFYDQFPFWRRYLEGLGFDVVLSGPTDPSVTALGIEACVAEPCFPIQVAHGQAKRLCENGADYVLLPNVVDRANGATPEHTWLCPWNQTMPFVVRAAPAFAPHVKRLLVPTLYFRLGPKHVKQQLAEIFVPLGATRRESDAAVEAAYEAQASFESRLQDAGRRALNTLRETGEPAVLLVGRPYNLYDRNQNCDLPRKLRALYGVNVVPFDFLPLAGVPIDDVNSNMFWFSGQRILAAGKFARQHASFHVIFVTNFKCGPDSFLKHFLRQAAGAPYLVLQFDGHGNDAGYLTRCEAYLDSKGALRCYAQKPVA